MNAIIALIIRADGADTKTLSASSALMTLNTVSASMSATSSRVLTVSTVCTFTVGGSIAPQSSNSSAVTVIKLLPYTSSLFMPRSCFADILGVAVKKYFLRL